MEFWLEPRAIQQARRICASFQHWTGRSLLPNPAQDEGRLAQQLFHWSQPVLSHGCEADPILNYGNQAALTLWELSWSEFVQLPSRLTAEPMAQAERAHLLAQAARQGYANNYSGVRISRTGRRFRIENAWIWTVLDEAGTPVGQAATFDQWQFL
ncbi:MEKHLA domain-containing protein [Thermosynechococcus sp. HN-54]|uniref:MEKHLA domain-containing protein n=1 Tax=Thermosynechococcus sp. HN-54 TaxID=2933959 RepID=UPI00202CD12D|nr:MEKHLA domain-containing protein [Thermosynechococcus sp. HN-54]URR35896.1 MEKHLA domain-containing protein [Thermosynechococcus sp. HN-54]